MHFVLIVDDVVVHHSAVAEVFLALLYKFTSLIVVKNVGSFASDLVGTLSNCASNVLMISFFAYCHLSWSNSLLRRHCCIFLVIFLLLYIRSHCIGSLTTAYVTGSILRSAVIVVVLLRSIEVLLRHIRLVVEGRCLRGNQSSYPQECLKIFLFFSCFVFFFFPFFFLFFFSR